MAAISCHDADEGNHWFYSERQRKRHGLSNLHVVAGSRHPDANVHSGVFRCLPGWPTKLLQTQQGGSNRMKRHRESGYTLVEVALVSGMSVMIAAGLVAM